MARYALTIFLSAFLLFQVQPLIGKIILPWFGGGPAVWSTCMLFFQIVLLLGYSYAHWITSKFTQRGQMICHLVLLALSLASLPVLLKVQAWKPHSGPMPIGQILTLLAATIGLPYFLLSTTGPLLQESFRRETGNPPYRLYSLSNIGSLLALLSYPFAFEPMLTLQVQRWGWSVGYGMFVLLCGWCAIHFTKPAFVPIMPEGFHAGEAVSARQPTWRDIGMWLALAACGSVMLLATTNQLCQEISSVPFLWVLPLAIYLITFIICFDHERWYHHNTFVVLLVAAALAACYAIYEGTAMEMWMQLAIYSSTLFIYCMACHGELVSSKPDPKYATLFYLMVSAGGAAGGILVAIVAPLVLHDFLEYHIALVATVILVIFATNRDQSAFQLPSARWLTAGALSVAVGLALGWSVGGFKSKAGAIEVNLETTRNFYGVLHVNLDKDPHGPNGPRNELIHGRIQHGFQYLDPDKSTMATTYYAPSSGVGMAIENHPRRGSDPMKIGVVGLGCGTLAVYGREGDTIRFYEINPEVIRISDEYFTYRKDSEAEVEVVLGDARINMEQEIADGNSQQFDVLAIDAFSSDSIPMHLLTVESVELYLKELKPDGLLCVHISNRFLDLSGVVRGIAEHLGHDYVLINDESDLEQGRDHSSWMIVAQNRDFLELDEIKDVAHEWDEDDAKPIVWTDDYGSLWQALD